MVWVILIEMLLLLNQIVDFIGPFSVENLVLIILSYARLLEAVFLALFSIINRVGESSNCARFDSCLLLVLHALTRIYYYAVVVQVAK